MPAHEQLSLQFDGVKPEPETSQRRLPTHGVIKGIGRVRIIGMSSKDHFDVLDNRDNRRVVHRDRLTFTKGS